MKVNKYEVSTPQEILRKEVKIKTGEEKFPSPVTEFSMSLVAQPR